MYDANGIQSQGRIFEVGEKTGSESGQYRQGETSKGRSRFCCQRCGIEFIGRTDEPRKYCSRICYRTARADVPKVKYKRKDKDEDQKLRDRERHQELRNLRKQGLVKPAVITKEPFWLECSKCLAKIGLGSKRTGRIIGVHGASVSTWWKRKGIKAQFPNGLPYGYTGESIKYRIGQEQRKRDRIYKRIQKDAAILTREIAKAIKPASVFTDYYSMTPEERRARNKALHKIRREKMLTNPEYKAKRREYSDKWKAANRNKVREWQKNANKKRKIIDPGFKVMCNLRHRFKEIMASCKRGKGDGFSRLTGCTTKQLAAHLSSQFKRGMTWDNYGTRWHVDHILPCASFDHTDPRQQAQCWHWNNLQPLEAKKNMAKSDTITQPQMQLLLCATH